MPLSLLILKVNILESAARISEGAVTRAVTPLLLTRESANRNRGGAGKEGRIPSRSVVVLLIQRALNVTIDTGNANLLEMRVLFSE